MPNNERPTPETDEAQRVAELRAENDTLREVIAENCRILKSYGGNLAHDPFVMRAFYERFDAALTTKGAE